LVQERNQTESGNNQALEFRVVAQLFLQSQRIYEWLNILIQKIIVLTLTTTQESMASSIMNSISRLKGKVQTTSGISSQYNVLAGETWPFGHCHSHPL